MAKEHSAINLSQGFPDFPIDKELSLLIEKSVRENIHQYCPSNGHPGLLDQIGGLIHKSYHRESKYLRRIARYCWRNTGHFYVNSSTCSPWR